MPRNGRDGELGYEVGTGGGAPGVVMVHDVWGLSEHTRDLADRLSGEGFAVLAVDLYRREGAVEITDAAAFIRDLPDPRVLADLREAASRLRADGAPRVGVTGFCMGGMYALLAACEPGFDAAVPFYGMLRHGEGLLAGPLDPARKPREPLAAAADLACPLLGLFGDEDAFVPVAQVEALRTALASSPHESEIVRYPGAGHAFMNSTRPQAFRPEAAADAWPRMVAFLRRHLGG